MKPTAIKTILEVLYGETIGMNLQKSTFSE